MISEAENIKNVGIIILAAGPSSRLGTPKQLLQYHGQSLLQHQVDAAAGSHANPVVVVLGANADLLENEIDLQKAHITINAQHAEGMASSIRAGLNALLEIAPSVEAAVFMVCDQPFVTSSLLNDLITAHFNTAKTIISCSYENTFGTPTLFHKNLFPELLLLRGEAGARKVVQKHPDKVHTISFPKGSIDIDTKADYENLLKNNGGE